MSNVRYKVVMKTPAGFRHGIIDLHLEEEQLSGTLDILGHIGQIEGHVEADGNCEIYGQLITLMQTIPYKAEGKVSSKRIDLILRGAQKEFYLSGVAITESEVKS